MDYTTTQVRPGLFLVRWHENKTGAFVSHVQDWDEGTVTTSIVLGDDFVLMSGTFTKVR